MEEILMGYFTSLPMVVLFIIIGATFVSLGKGADILVDKAVSLSKKMGISRVVIGATIVSLGTTLPEVSVSVMAAINGDPGLAIGNGVGSIICDTGLILGLAALVAPLPVPLATVNRQGNIQILSALLLIVFSVIFAKGNVFEVGGYLPQFSGYILVALLIAYMVYTFYASKNDAGSEDEKEEADEGEEKEENLVLMFIKLVLGIALVVLSSKVLIPAVTEVATRANIPESIIGATLVAFGTSLPELITAITSARKGFGDLAIGNIVGADILNVLSVIGISTAVTSQGLEVDKSFFLVAFPSMIGVILIFRLSVFVNKGKPLSKGTGMVLLLSYVAFSVASFYIIGK